MESYTDLRCRLDNFSFVSEMNLDLYYRSVRWIDSIHSVHSKFSFESTLYNKQTLHVHSVLQMLEEVQSTSLVH